MLLSIGSVVLAQTEQSNKKISDKHHFGFGVTTDIFSGDENLNNFEAPFIDTILLTTERDNLDLRYSRFLSFYFEYQYQFARNWSLSSRLKFNNRYLSYHYLYDAISDDISINLWDLEIPVMANFRLPVSRSNYWIASAGIGVKFNIYSPNFDILKNHSIHLDNGLYNNYQLEFDDHYKTNFFLSVGTGFEFQVSKHRLQTFISYTAFFLKEYSFYHNSIGANGTTFFRELAGDTFRQNNLEVGVTFFL